MKRQILRVLDSRACEVLVYLTIFLLNLRLYLFQTRVHSDLTTHLGYIEMYFGQGQQFYLPHPLFHILVHGLSLVTGMSDATAMATLMSVLTIVSIALCKLLIRHYRPGLAHPSTYLFAALAVNYFTAIFVPAYNPKPYLGQWSPNIWHSPTMALLKPLAILGFCGTIACLVPSQREQRGLAGMTSLALFLGVLAKPSFIVCFIPAVGLFLLVFHTKDWRLWRKAFLLFLPCLGLLAWQFLRTYTRWAVPTYFKDHIILTNFAVTRMNAPSVLISTLLVWAFPLSVLLVIRKGMVHNKPLLLSFILALVGFLQGSLLSEENKLKQGAFIFGYIISLFMVYLFSFIEYLGWFQDRKDVKFAWKATVSVVMVAHLVSGLVYWQGLLAARYIY